MGTAHLPSGCSYMKTGTTTAVIYNTMVCCEFCACFSFDEPPFPASSQPRSICRGTGNPDGWLELHWGRARGPGMSFEECEAACIGNPACQRFLHYPMGYRYSVVQPDRCEEGTDGESLEECKEAAAQHGYPKTSWTSELETT